MPKACWTSRKRVDVAAAYSPTAASGLPFPRPMGFATCDSAEAIFHDPSITAVMILTPPSTHLDLVRQAAEAGKHVLLEKPLEITPERIGSSWVTVGRCAPGIKSASCFSTAFAGSARNLRGSSMKAASANRHAVGPAAQLRPRAITINGAGVPGSPTGGGVLLTRPYTRSTFSFARCLPGRVQGLCGDERNSTAWNRRPGRWRRSASRAAR